MVQLAIGLFSQVAAFYIASTTDQLAAALVLSLFGVSLVVHDGMTRSKDEC